PPTPAPGATWALPPLPRTAPARRARAAKPARLAAMAHRHPQGDPTTRRDRRDGTGNLGRCRRTTAPPRALRTSAARRRQQLSTSVRPRAPEACLSRGGGRPAPPVLRGPAG